jgi:cytosine/adenosine deaminase-related metal-dependent hydrolase
MRSAAAIAENQLGRIVPGHDADLLIVDGNPLEDISVTERLEGRGSLFQFASQTVTPITDGCDALHC